LLELRSLESIGPWSEEFPTLVQSNSPIFPELKDTWDSS